MSESKPRTPSRSKVVITKYVGFAIPNFQYEVQDATGIILKSGLKQTEKECRDEITRLRKVLKNNFMKIDTEEKIA